MRQQPVSEKVLEILFIRYLLQDFGLGEITVFAPTSREERREGYDAKLVGNSAFRELYLQFKSPFYADQAQRFTAYTTEHQHKVLKELDSDYAYYIISHYPSLRSLIEAQEKARNPSVFLRNFIAIEISSLCEEVASFHYDANETIMYKLRGKTKQKPKDILGRSNWMWGDELLYKFKLDQVGMLIERLDNVRNLEVAEDSGSSEMRDYSAPWFNHEYMSEWSRSDFGVHLRKIVSPGA